MTRAHLAALAVLLALVPACGGRVDAALSTDLAAGGDSRRGRTLIEERNCGSCHTIPGVRGAHGVVAPPLLWYSRRTFIAGEVPNTPANLVRWVRNPQAIEPRTAMPPPGVSEQQARDIAAYLYTLR